MVFLELRRDSRVTTGNSGCLLCWPRPEASGISGLHSRRTRGDRHSSRVEAKNPALLSSRDGYLLEWHPRLLPQIFLVVELHPPIPSGFLVTTGSRLSPGLLSPDPTFQHPACLHLQTHLRLGCTGLWHGPPVEVSLCPACHRLVAVFSNSSSVPGNSPANEGASPGTGPSLLLHLPPWGARSHSASCFFFLSFILPGYAEIFVVLSAAQSPLLVFSMYSENCSNCRCILDVFVGRGELHVLLLCHLDSSPRSTILNFMFPAFLY